jgi:hypothetical protein
MSELPVNALGSWRTNPAYRDLGISPGSAALLDASEQEEARIAQRVRERTAANIATHQAASDALAGRHEEQLRIDQLADDELRSELQDAIDHVAATKLMVTNAETVVNSAAHVVSMAAQRCDQYANVDTRVDEYRADAARRGADPVLPCDLIEARREQRMATDELRDARNTLDRLTADLTQATTRATEAEHTRDRAAIAVLNRHCEHKAAELTDAYERIHDLRQHLLTVTSIWVPFNGNAVSLPVSDNVRNALRRNDVRPDIDGTLKTASEAWLQTLKQDAYASLEVQRHEAGSTA